MSSETGTERESLSPLARALRNLRKGAGVTPDKLRRTPNVMAALKASNGKDALDRLKQLIEQLDAEQFKIEALLTAYAIDVEPPGLLTERRANYAATIGKSAESVELYENDVIVELEALLQATDSVTNPHLAGWPVFTRTSLVVVQSPTQVGVIETEAYAPTVQQTVREQIEKVEVVYRNHSYQGSPRSSYEIDRFTYVAPYDIERDVIVKLKNLSKSSLTAWLETSPSLDHLNTGKVTVSAPQSLDHDDDYDFVAPSPPAGTVIVVRWRW